MTYEDDFPDEDDETYDEIVDARGIRVDAAESEGGRETATSC